MQRGGVVVRNDQPGVKGLAHAVAREVPHHAVLESFGVGLDDSPDHVDLASRLHRLDATFHGDARPLDQERRFIVNLPDGEARVGVSVDPIEVGSHVNVHDVTLVQDGGVRDPVADHFDDGRADRFRESLIVQW